MRTEFLLIGIGAAVLLSYWFVHLGRVLRLPSVVFLLATGLIARAAVQESNLSLEAPAAMLPLLGTLGLILIVLEGALDLELERGQRKFILQTSGAALAGLLALVLPAGAALHYAAGFDWAGAFLIATPFAVISSAVAIPASSLLPAREREFVVYESSWSDILGVMIFNAAAVAYEGGGATTNLVVGGLAVLAIGGVIGLAMYWLVGHLEGHVKFMPLIFALILVYGAAKALHLSPLLIVMLLGLLLNNAHVLRKLRWLEPLHSAHYGVELDKLKHLTAEATFLARTFFFLLLGYQTDFASLADWRAWALAAIVVAFSVAVRWVVLYLVDGRRTRPLLWVTPRGLITVLLFYSLPESLVPADFPRGALILVVLLSCAVMAAGLRADVKPGASSEVDAAKADESTLDPIEG